MKDTFAAVVFVLWFAAVIVVPVSCFVRFASALFSSGSRNRIRRHPRAHVAWAVLAILVVFLLGVCMWHAMAEARENARRINCAPFATPSPALVATSTRRWPTVAANVTTRTRRRRSSC